MSKNGKMRIEKLASMVVRGFSGVEERMVTKDNIKGLATKIDLEDVERRLSAKIDTVEEKVDNLEMGDVLNLQGRVAALEKDVKQLKKHV